MNPALLKSLLRLLWRSLPLLLLVAVVATLWWQHHALANVRAALDASAASVTRLQAQLATAQATERIVTRTVDRVRVVREKGATVIKQVPVYVTAAANDRCLLPVGFVSVHNAAAQGLPLPAPAGNPDAPAAGLTLAAVADTVADNYTTCHEIRESLIGLQAWAAAMADPAATGEAAP